MDFVARWTLRSGAFVGAAAPLIDSILQPAKGRLELFASCPDLQEFPGVGLGGWAVAWLLVALATVPVWRERDDLSLATVVGLGIWSAFSIGAVFSYRAPAAILMTGMAGALISAVLPLALKDLEATATWSRFAWALLLIILAVFEIDFAQIPRTPVSVWCLGIGGMVICVGEMLARRLPQAGLPEVYARPRKASGE